MSVHTVSVWISCQLMHVSDMATHFLQRTIMESNKQIKTLGQIHSGFELNLITLLQHHLHIQLLIN